MSANLILTLILALTFGILFFIADYYEHKIFQLHASYIAGISVVYFFLIVLPEIAERLPEFPFHLDIFEYLFVLIGFVFVHITEKIIILFFISLLQSLQTNLTGILTLLCFQFRRLFFFISILLKKAVLVGFSHLLSKISLYLWLNREFARH